MIVAVSSLELSARSRLLKPSPTLAMTARARKLKSEGIDVVSFAAGEPDFNTPEPICEAAIRAIRSGMTKYTPSPGIHELRAAIAEKLTAENNIPTSPDQVVVSCGAKHSLFNAMQAVVNPGDEVILIAPYWMTYADQVSLSGGRVVKIRAQASNNFIPTTDQIREAISPKTKAIVLNSPCNPTGAVLTTEVLEVIGALAIQHGFWIITDEIYEKLAYEVVPLSIASLGPHIAERTITIGGCSKSFSMTGWRIGYSACARDVAQAISNIQDQVTSNATSFAQAGAIEALRMPCSTVENMRDEFKARRDLMYSLMQEVPDLPLSMPQGAFYLLPDVSAYLRGSIQDDVALAEYLLDSARIATIPGTVFEGAGHIRFSYAASESDIRKGMTRFAKAMNTLRG